MGKVTPCPARFEHHRAYAQPEPAEAGAGQGFATNLARGYKACVTCS
jgi:hypothetical protein